MKKTITLPKRLFSPPIDFSAAIASRSACGVALEYTEYGFIQLGSGRVVLFDAYSAAHAYEPYAMRFGVIAFPFSLTCMTDSGERVAYAGLRFGEDEITEWKLCHARDCSELYARLTVDPDAAATPIMSGVCGLADADDYALYRSRIKDDPLAGQIVLNGETHKVVELFGKKYAVFSTGWGDGQYRSYVGCAADGRAVALTVDFGMIDYGAPSDETVEVEIDEKDMFVYDPTKTATENNIAMWTHRLETAASAKDRLNALSRRGYAYHSSGNKDAALADYEAAIETSRSVGDRAAMLRSWSVFDNAAELYIEKADYPSAIAVMNAALEIGDNFYTGAYVRLIDLYQLTKNGDKAVETAERLIGKRPDDPVANMKFAEVCVSVMDYARAAKTYERLATEFRLYENLFDEASCLIELGDYDGADAALESHPATEYSEQYWYYKAYIDLKRRNYRAALAKAEKSHSIDPEYMPALYLLIDIESLLQEYHAVATYAEEYKKLRPNKEYGFSVCAEAHLILGNFSECSRNYYYLYENVKHDDKYAALAAITAARMGDVKRKSAILRRLRRKRSAYYYGAIYAIYIKRNSRRDMALSNVMYKLDADDDFLLQLATYLTASGNLISASRLLKMLSYRNAQSPELVAQQIRTAAAVNDEKLFASFFEYYTANYVGGLDADDMRRLAARFRGTDADVGIRTIGARDGGKA